MVVYNIAQTADETHIAFSDWNGTGTALLTENIIIDYVGSESYITHQIGEPSGTVIFDGQFCTIKVVPLVADTFLGLFTIKGNSHNVIIRNLIVIIDDSYNPLSSYGAGILDVYNTPIPNTIRYTLLNCAVIGTPENNYRFTIYSGGGLVNGVTANSNVTIKNCYTTGVIDSSSVAAGGIIGYSGSSFDSMILIDNCFTTGDINGDYCGGIAGRAFGFGTNNQCIIRNCYSTGAINGNYAGGIVGGEASYGVSTISTGDPTYGAYAAGPGIKLVNCYAAGTYNGSVNSGILIGDMAGNCTIENCFGLNAIDNTSTYGTGQFVGNHSGGNLSLTSNTAGNGSWTASIGSDLLNTGTNTTNIWDVSTNPFRLSVFENSPWQSSDYTSYNPDRITYSLAAGSFGDPHITPFSGTRYDLSIKGAYRHFDNCNIENRFIINGLIMPGLHKHYKLDYIRKIFIKHNTKTLEADMGFRGQLVKIINNNGFDIKEYSMPIIDNITRKCVKQKCKYFTLDYNDNSHNNDTHYVPAVIRNCIEINIDVENDNKYTIYLTNVSYENKSPCSIELKLKNPSIVGYFGACVREEDNIDLLKIDSLYE